MTMMLVNLSIVCHNLNKAAVEISLLNAYNNNNLANLLPLPFH